MNDGNSPCHFHYKSYNWNIIHRVYVRRYNPVGEYGGWGVCLSRWHFAGRRIKLSRAIAHTVSGRTELQIELKKSKRILIGTLQPEELKKVLVRPGKAE
jgi:hypothetical protein